MELIREVKSITLGSSYDFIELDKYTNNKTSIKIKFKNTGEEFTKWSLTKSGTIKIELGVIDYEQYENPYEIKVIVEYETCELPLNLNDIDTLEGLKRHIVDLESLDYIRTIRSVAHRKFGIRLNEFIIFNTILFDQFGQGMKLKYENHNNYNYSFTKIITLDEFQSRVKEYSYGNDVIPRFDDICPHCKQKWNLNNINDCITRGNHVYHIDCNKYNLYDNSKKEFDYIASKVFNQYDIHSVKNEYGSENYNGCWFIITTPEGDIRIGWRKRVIQIEWLQNYKLFQFDGNNENVTKMFTNTERYIHAWDNKKAIEYLKESKRTILR